MTVRDTAQPVINFKLASNKLDIDALIGMTPVHPSSVTPKKSTTATESITGIESNSVNVIPDAVKEPVKIILPMDLLRIIQNVIILSIFKFARYTYYKKNIVNYGNESVYLLDYVMTLIVSIIFYILGFEKISIGIFIDQLLSMILYDKINDDKVLLLPYYLPFVLI